MADRSGLVQGVKTLEGLSTEEQRKRRLEMRGRWRDEDIARRRRSLKHLRTPAVRFGTGLAGEVSWLDARTCRNYPQKRVLESTEQNWPVCGIPESFGRALATPEERRSVRGVRWEH